MYVGVAVVELPRNISENPGQNHNNNKNFGIMDFYAVEVQLTSGKNVIITTKWEETEVEVEVFQENAELVLRGRKKLSDMEKQCKILSLELNDVKDALTSHDSFIQFEINDSQTKVNMINLSPKYLIIDFIF